MEKTASGLQENVAGLMCYALFWISGLILYLIETENRFVRFHAVQSMIIFGFLNVVGIVFGWMPWFGLILGPLIGISVVILWIVLMIKAYQGEMYKLPVVGGLAEKWSAKKED